jgi:hypothetical protein
MPLAIISVPRAMRGRMSHRELKWEFQSIYCKGGGYLWEKSKRDYGTWDIPYRQWSLKGSLRKGFWLGTYISVLGSAPLALEES